METQPNKPLFSPVSRIIGYTLVGALVYRVRRSVASALLAAGVTAATVETLRAMPKKAHPEKQKKQDLPPKYQGEEGLANIFEEVKGVGNKDRGAPSKSPYPVMKDVDPTSSENAPFNRYAIYPHPHNCVQVEGVPYINASWVPSKLCQNDPCRSLKPKDKDWENWIKESCPTSISCPDFITTQAPLKSTASHFWEMVWQYDVPLILCFTSDGCHQYWPEGDTETQEGEFTLRLAVTQSIANGAIAKFQLTKGKEKRFITQIRYTAWTAKKMISVEQLQALIANVDEKLSSTSAPVVVHDSSGSGRAKAFLACYFRHKNPQLHAKHFLPALDKCRKGELSKYMSLIQAFYKGPEKATSCLQTPYPVVHNCDPSSEKNRSLNRYADILPHSYNCVDIGGYINASWLPKWLFVQEECVALQEKRERLGEAASWKEWAFAERTTPVDHPDFIATQGPTATTTPDFWKMVWQYDVPLIVCLTNTTESNWDKCAQYWPVDHRERKQGDITIQATALPKEDGRYKITKIKIKKGQQEREVIHLQFTGWADHSAVTPATLPTLFKQFEAAHQTSRKSGPVVIHCSAGCGRTGAFLACYAKEKNPALQHHQFLEALRACRPDMVQMSQEKLVEQFYSAKQ